MHCPGKIRVFPLFQYESEVGILTRHIGRMGFRSIVQKTRLLFRNLLGSTVGQEPFIRDPLPLLARAIGQRCTSAAMELTKLQREIISRAAMAVLGLALLYGG